MVRRGAQAWLRWMSLLSLGYAGSGLGQEAQPSSEHNSPAIRMAVLGDSLATGAATHPALTFDTTDLWKVFNGEVSVATDLPPPQRLWPSPREFFGNGDWIFRNLMQGLARAYLDTPEYSWGYVLAQQLGLPANDLAIAGEDGARLQHATRHIDRLLDATQGVLPERVFLFYTGNDLCAASMAGVTSSHDYGADLRKTLNYILRNGKPAVGSGSDIYVVSYLSVLQLLHSEAILAKSIKAFGEQTTCRDLRARGYRPKSPDYKPEIVAEAWYFAMLMPPNPAGFCPTLFSSATGSARDEEIGALANLIRDYRQVQKSVVEDTRERLAKDTKDVVAHPGGGSWRVHYLSETAELIFDANDIAGDCFHLSAQGQQKVADAIARNLARLE